MTGRSHQIRKPRGFTIVELMITLAVIATLAALAMPSYQDYVKRSRRSDAFVTMARIQQAQEKWRANNVLYASDFGALALGTSNSLSSEKGFYTISLGLAGSGCTGTPSGTQYCIKAVASSNQSQTSDKAGSVSCATLTMQITNANTTYSPAECWAK